jgi:hypothetical protein
MKLEDARGAYEALSGKASDIVRQLSLAGVGLIWVFKSGADTSNTILSLDPELLKAAVFIFLALVLDFLQYFVGTSIWFVFYRYKERQGTQELSEFLAPSQLNWPMWGLFYLKSAMMLIAYAVYIIPFLISRLGA